MNADIELRCQEQLPSLEVLTYPFAESCLTATEADVAATTFDSMHTEFSLFEHPERSRPVVLAFLTHCMSTGSPQDAIARLTEVLALIIYLNDRVGNEDLPELIDSSLLALWSLSRTNVTPIAQASAEVQRRLEPYVATDPSNGLAFLHALERTWCAFRWESEFLHTLPSDAEDYEELRMNTIAVKPFLATWKLLHRFPAAARLRHGELLRRIDHRATRVQYLANDLGSVKRDIGRGQRNVVVLEARQHAVSLVDAWAAVRQRHDVEVEKLAADLQALRKRDRSAEINAYLDEVEACIWGNLRCLQILISRYKNA